MSLIQSKSPCALCDRSSSIMNTRYRLGKREKMNMMMGSDENQDFISKLPDDILAFILSKLRVDEAVRCNILSKRWVGLWKQTSHMEFNAKHMIRPLTQLLYSRESLTDLDSTLSPSMRKRVFRYGIKIFQLMYRHSDNISSCQILHFRKSLVIGEVNTWIDFLVNKKKGLKVLSLECVPDCGETVDKATSEDEIHKPCFLRGIFYCLVSLELINYTIDCSSAFEDCHNLRILKLKRIHVGDATLNGILENCVVLENFSLLESTGFARLIIMKSKLRVLKLQALCVDHLEVTSQNLDVLFLDSIICPAKNVFIYAPNLQNFQYHGCSIFSATLSVEERKLVMEPHEILTYYNDRSGPRPSSMTTIFENLVTLFMDFDMKNIRNAITLSFTLKSCHHLNNLQINNQVNDDSWDNNSWVYHKNEDDLIPYPDNLFWQRRELCECINHQLKSLCIKGYTGKELEMEFVKYIITNAGVIERITLWFVDDCLWDEATTTFCLLSFSRASTKLSVDLKPGTEYTRKVGGSFQMWVTTLRSNKVLLVDDKNWFR